MTWFQAYESFENRGKFPLRHRRTVPAESGPWVDRCGQVCQLVGSGFLVALIGNRGTGKSRMAVEIGRAAMYQMETFCEPQRRCDTPAMYRTAIEIFMSMRAGFGEKGAEKSVVDTLIGVPMLIIDEIQERGETPWEDRMLTYIIDRRYGAMRDTLLIGNIVPAELQASLGSSIVSRIRECGLIVNCDWPSFRGAK